MLVLLWLQSLSSVFFFVLSVFRRRFGMYFDGFLCVLLCIQSVLCVSLCIQTVLRVVCAFRALCLSFCMYSECFVGFGMYSECFVCVSLCIQIVRFCSVFRVMC